MPDKKKKNKKLRLIELGTIRLFVIWGILESLIYFITKGDKLTALYINLILFIIINIVLYYVPKIEYYI
jgi:hypothetical protein